MPHLSLRVSQELLGELDHEADENGVSRSDYIRNTLDERHRADELEARLEDLRRQLQAVNADEREIDDVVEFVREERELRRRREGRIQRREERRDAPLWRRLRWFVFGRR